MIRTKRLLLREFIACDFDSVVRLLQNPLVMQFSLRGELGKKEIETYFHELLSSYHTFGYGKWALTLQEESTFIGWVGLDPYVLDGVHKVQLSYVLDPNYWGKGYAKEACFALCHYAFTEYTWTELIALIKPENKKSVQLALYLNMHLWKKTLIDGHEVHVYSLNKVTIAPYINEYDIYFNEIKEDLSSYFEETTFYFIGSTSIPGCFAKPIIDILGVTPDITQIKYKELIMKRLGYDALGEFGMKRRSFFVKKAPLAVNLHIFEDTDVEVERHLRFCDFLRRHSEWRDLYSNLKIELASKYRMNRFQYTLEKSDFIKTVDRIAALEATDVLAPMKKHQRKVDWTQEELLKAIDDNFYLFMTFFTKYVSSADFIFAKDVTLVRCPNILTTDFNYVLDANFDSPCERIQEIRHLYTSMNLPFSWWVGPQDNPKSLQQYLLEAGFFLNETFCGMSLDLRAFNQHCSPSVCIQRVVSSIMMEDFIHVLADSNVPVKGYELTYKELPPVLYQKQSIHFYVSYSDKEPITIGMLILHANVAGIYTIMTKPGQRLKGHATAMVIYLLNVAKEEGFNTASLLASSEGKPLYERLGFKECCTYSEFSSLRSS